MNNAILSQSLSVQIFAGAIDILQRVEPAANLEAHERRTRAAIVDLGNWLAGLSVDDVATIVAQGRLLIDRWMPESDEYDALGVCAIAQAIIRETARNTALTTEHLHDLVTGAGMYLADLDDHKLSYLYERAASLLTLTLDNEAA
ncbi:hypothetical protein [Acidithiobacillus caldus]|uniref:hypothetical protein n=1 Tax=Acidithiobacillus caldus TaxID=33059 RepID=UPI0007D9D246|nr:hypothetical protein [Acidithiobacillus caldus]QER43212.1 hypothetical protein F0726_00120 [Acidithiobacillus caldus]